MLLLCTVKTPFHQIAIFSYFTIIMQFVLYLAILLNLFNLYLIVIILLHSVKSTLDFFDLEYCSCIPLRCIQLFHI